MSAKTKSIKRQTPVNKVLSSIKKSNEAFLARRPHRSFRRTRRRDFVRSLKLPGYLAFSAYVRRTLLQNKKTFLLLALVYAVLTAIMVGVASQDAYSQLMDTIKQTSGDLFAGFIGEIGQASLVLLASASGALNNTLTGVQQVYAALIMLLSWLTTVWLLRNILAGHKVKLRDGLYNASSPILSTFLIVIVLIIQLIPLALAILGYTAAQSTGLLNGGVESMLFWIAAGLLTLLSLYLITSTFIALVVVTLPGMYPLQALRTAGDLVIGRRIRILLRLLWMGLGVAVAWILVMVPAIMLDTWIKGIWPAILWVPTVPLLTLALSSLTVIWVASYIYLLYRRIVADDAAPA